MSSKSSRSSSRTRASTSRSSTTRRTRRSRGTRSAPSTGSTNVRIAASSIVPGDMFVMNGQKPAVILDSRTWSSDANGDAHTMVMMRREDGGLLPKMFAPTDKVLVVRNRSLDATRKSVSATNHVYVNA